MRCIPIARGQSGFTMIALITLLALLSAYLLSSLLTKTNSEALVDRSQRAQDALLQAKAALIAYAADANSTQPGSLPCPDTNNDGVWESSCSGQYVVVGRLPWQSLGLGDLRDASGERLWYAMSPRFRKMSSNVINSDTRGQLTVTDTTGTVSASNVVAVVIAPGQALGGQSRDAAHTNSAVSYMESNNAGTTGIYTYATTAQPSDTFNDRIIAITEADLFAMIEPVVAGMIERDVKPYLATYYSQWTGAFPFPSKFANPNPGTNTQISPAVASTRPQNQYLGDTTVVNEGGGTGRGLLPITASVTYPWISGSGAVNLTGGTAGSISGVSCSSVASPFDGWQCSFTINSINLGANSANWGPCNWNRYCMIDPSFSVQGVAANAGTSFPKLPNPITGVTVTSSGGTPRLMSAPAINGTLSASGNGTVKFQGTHSYSKTSGSSFTRSMKVTIPDLTVSPLTSSSEWFIANEWYRVTYYAVSPAYLPGVSSGGCPARGTCLTVNSMPSPSTATRALLILAGRSLNDSARPSTTLANYLEGENATPGDYVFEHRAGPPSSINDRVVVICPDSVLCQ